MKIFTKKIFLLAIGMILSVGAYAQDAITHHWPELQFTIVNADGTATDGVVYTVPGWDAWLLKGTYTNGHIRVQKYEKTGDKEYKARLVTRYATYGERRLYVPRLNVTTVWVKFVGHEDIGVKNLIGLQYKDVFETETGPDGTSYNVSILDATNTGTVSKITGEYKIPVKMTHGKSGEVYNIDEIDDYAFRQPSRSAEDKNYVQATKIIVPKEITKIGRGAFFMNGHTTEIEFEDGCPVTDILEFNFQDNTALQKITFSANVNKLLGTVLGGCKALRKITFKGENPPALPTFTWSGVDRQVFETTTDEGATKPDQCIIEVPLHSAKAYADKNNLYKQFPMSSKFTMNKAYVTFCSDLPFTFKQYDTANKAWNDGDVKAYYVVYDNVKDGKVTLTEITEAKKIPSTTTLTRTGYFGVVLNGTAKETYDIFYPNNLISDELQVSENCMQGVVKETKMGGENPDMAMDTEHYTYFVLTDGKFLTVTEPGTFGAHKAFLMIEGLINIPAGARELTISLPDETTGITTHEVEGEQNDAWYTLQGIQVNQPGKGIFIKNGKKYIIK
jgi:hypothetical protein